MIFHNKYMRAGVVTFVTHGPRKITFLYFSYAISGKYFMYIKSDLKRSKITVLKTKSTYG